MLQLLGNKGLCAATKRSVDPRLCEVISHEARAVLRHLFFAGFWLFVDELGSEACLDDPLERHCLALVLEELGAMSVDDVIAGGPHSKNAEL